MTTCFTRPYELSGGNVAVGLGSVVALGVGVGWGGEEPARVVPWQLASTGRALAVARPANPLSTARRDRPREGMRAIGDKENAARSALMAGAPHLPQDASPGCLGALHW